MPCTDVLPQDGTVDVRMPGTAEDTARIGVSATVGTLVKSRSMYLNLGVAHIRS